MERPLVKLLWVAESLGSRAATVSPELPWASSLNLSVLKERDLRADFVTGQERGGWEPSFNTPIALEPHQHL